MRYLPLAVVAATVLTLLPLGAMATTILNQDNETYAVSISSSSGAEVIEIAPNSQQENICGGCDISLDDGQVIQAEADDVVVILDGALIIKE